MIRRIAAVLAFICALTGCAEGGSRGTGISTEVQGNVVAIEPQAAGLADEFSVTGIEVSVEKTGATTTTDADGRFSLRGSFYGPITLIFRQRHTDLLARIAVSIPAGGTLALIDVSIDAAAHAAFAANQEVQCEGVITATMCSEPSLTMISAFQEPGPDSEVYVVRLDTSVVEDSAGNALPCSQLRIGQHAAVQASVNDDGSFGNATIEVEP